MFSIILGVIILIFAAWCWREEEVDLLFWSDWGWLDVDKTNHPFLFWLAFSALALTGLGSIVWGILSSYVSP